MAEVQALMAYRDPALAEREAEITEALRAGPLTVYGIAVMLVPDGTLPGGSMTARITQSLRVMEREKIVKRETRSRRTYWSLAR